MAQLTTDARGVFIIAVTPFRDDGALDLAAVDGLVEFYLAHGVHGMTILGMMGEAPKLTAEEAQAFATRVLKRVAGRVPVVVGVSSPGFATMRHLSQTVMDAGAAGVMAAPPASTKGDAAVERYFTQVAETVGAAVPFVLQDYPLVTNVVMPVTVIQRLAAELPNCVMLKHEDWPGLDKISQLRAGEAEGQRRLSVLCGNGGLFLPLELQRGADGAMTGFAYPEMLVEICRLHVEGRIEAMYDLYDAYLPLVRYEQQPGVGLVVRKHILHGRGALPSAALRAPAPRLSAPTQADIALLQTRLARALTALPERRAAA